LKPVPSSPIARALRRTLVLVVAVAGVLLSSGRAAAYPQWQLSTGATRCDQCHFAPAGGGLINSYGRDAAGEDLSMFGGDGALLHGHAPLPSWLALGADLRGAFAAQDSQDPRGVTRAFFPMQADAQARFAYELFSFYGVLGLRGQVRDSDETVPADNYQPASTSRLVSREHYVMMRASALGGYVRAGRFFAPFGLRMAEHILYVRRDLGLGTLEETYNLSSGYVGERWETHVTAFGPDFIRHMGSREAGLAGYVERRFADVALAAVQARVAAGPDMTRTIAGAVGKYWIEPLRTMVVAEANFVRRDISAVSPRYGFVGAGGVSLLPTRGLMATVLGELNQVDLAVGGARYTAGTAFVSWFPYAHFEVQALGRLQFPSGQSAASTFFLQIHYFL
jgi:hypothetical protein